MAVAVKAISKIDDKQGLECHGSSWEQCFGFITAYQVLAALISKIPRATKNNLQIFLVCPPLYLVLLVLLHYLKLFSINDLQSSLGKMTAILLVLAANSRTFLVLLLELAEVKKPL